MNASSNMNNELGRIWKEAVVMYFDATSHNLGLPTKNEGIITGFHVKTQTSDPKHDAINILSQPFASYCMNYTIFRI
jgi:hypothetical protein